MQNTTNPPSLDVLRAKLDAAIVAEAWPAVSAIAARIREVERDGVVELDAERAKRHVIEKGSS